MYISTSGTTASSTLLTYCSYFHPRRSPQTTTATATWGCYSTMRRCKESIPIYTYKIWFTCSTVYINTATATAAYQY